MRNRGRRIIFENRGTKKAYVNKIKAGTEGRLSNDVFVVVGAGGERVLFAGIPAGRVGGLQHYGVFCLPVPAACFSD